MAAFDSRGPWPAMRATLALLYGLAAAPVGAAPPAPAASAGSAQAATLSHGLILRLRDAVAHDDRSQASLADAPVRQRALEARQRMQARLTRVLAATDPGGASGQLLPAVQAIGRDQHLLRFVRPQSPAETEAWRQRLMAQPEVEWVEINARERRLSVPSDALYAASAGYEGQWWLMPVSGAAGNALADRRRGVPGVQSGWTLPDGIGKAGAAIAVLDTGITAHPDLAGKVLPGYDLVSWDEAFGAAYANDGDGRDSDPSDPGDWVDTGDQARNPAAFSSCQLEPSSWHGTVVAGIAAAATDNVVGVAGVNWHARVLPVRVAGKCGATVSDIIDGMRWAAGLPVAGLPMNPNPARIVNISFGGSSACGAAYQAAVDELRAAGVVVVAAAGNKHGAPTRPANCSGVVGVVGLNRDGFKSHHSNFGAALGSHGIATVSGDDSTDASARWNALADSGIVSVHNLGKSAPAAASYAAHFGTSHATPIVSGVLSLMLGVNPSLTAQALLDGLRRSARPHVTSSQIGQCSESNPGRCLCTTATCGVGILDAEQALRYAADPLAYAPGARVAAVIDHPDVAALAAVGADRVANAVPPSPSPEAAAVGTDSVGGGGSGSAAFAMWLLLATAALRWVPSRMAARSCREVSAVGRKLPPAGQPRQRPAPQPYPDAPARCR